MTKRIEQFLKLLCKNLNLYSFYFYRFGSMLAVHHKLVFKKIIVVITRNRNFARVFYHRNFLVYVSAFEADKSVVNGMMVFGRIFPFGPGKQIGKRSHRARHHKIVLKTHFLGTRMKNKNIFQTNFIFHGFHHFQFLAYRIYQMKTAFGKKNSQWYTGETTTGSQIHHLGSAFELNKFCNA